MLSLRNQREIDHHDRGFSTIPISKMMPIRATKLRS